MSRTPKSTLLAAVALVLCVAVAGTGCVAGRETDTARLLRQGREAFVAGDFGRAGDLFRLAAAQAPEEHEAWLGAARSDQQAHDYDAAIAAYLEALQLAPGDALTWRSYVEALYEGGVQLGNGARLDTVLEVAPAALHQAPDEVEIYEHVLRTAAALHRLDDYAAILEAVAGELPRQPTPQIELARARILDARRRRNSSVGAPDYEALAAEVANLEAALGADLEATSGAAVASAEATPPVLYKLAVGYALLGDPGRADPWLEALDRSAAGRRMAAPMRYEQFLSEWVAIFDEDATARIELADRWLPRFEPQWTDNGARYRAILGMQFDVMIAAARDALAVAAAGVSPESGAASGSPDAAAVEAVAEPGGVSSERADRLTRVGRELARIDSGRRASRFVETASVLARIPSHYHSAVRISEEGIEALREGRPGLLSPATHEDDREEVELRYIAVLMQLQGQALHNLGRGDEAEETLREAISLYPVAASYAVLAGLLLDQGRDAEAFDLFVAALARGFGATETALEEQTRISALESAARIGAPPDVVAQAIAFAAELVEEERDRAILADPLDRPAPDFELDDTKGETWRLSELAGKVVVLNYWATWCGPCIAEMPYYQGLVDEYGDAAEVVFLAVSTDSDPSVVASFVEDNGYTFRVLLDRGSAADFGISGVPAGLIIGADGLIKYRTSGFPGPQLYLREMRLRIDALRADGR